MAWLPRIELTGFNGFLVILALILLLWALFYTSGAIITLLTWLVIIFVALVILKYTVLFFDDALRRGGRNR